MLLLLGSCVSHQAPIEAAPAPAPAPAPESPCFSEAGEGEHGQKLYALHAMDPAAYGFPPSVSPPAPLPEVSQAIVKASYRPVPPGESAQLLSPVARDGALYAAGEPLGLFVMIRLSEELPGTDQGWIYAVTDPDGAVTAEGNLPSCQGCHERAGPDRLYGVDLRE